MQAVKIALIGPMGAGKTSVGLALSKLLQCNFIDTDKEIELKCNLSVKQIFAQHGEQYFREHETKILQQVLTNKSIVLATGGGSILNAENSLLLQQHCVVCYLQVSVDQQLQRLTSDTQRPLLPPETVRADFLHNLAMQRNYIYTKHADIIVNTDHMTITALTLKLQAQIIDFLKQGVICI